MFSSARLLAVVALGATMAACAHRSPDTSAIPNDAYPGQVSKSSTASAADSEKVTLHVRNDMFNDVNVFAYRQGMRFRLGLVTGTSAQDIVLPKYLVQPGAELVFVALPIGGRRYTTSGRVFVDPGDVVDFWIPAHG